MSIRSLQFVVVGHLQEFAPSTIGRETRRLDEKRYVEGRTGSPVSAAIGRARDENWTASGPTPLGMQ
jgi:hypothetical protein